MKLLLTLDYELFFGAPTGTPEHCIIRPTDALLEQCADQDVRLTLFVDTCYLDALARQSDTVCRNALTMIEAQLTRLSKSGHDLQLHLHPHWLDCHWHNGSWVIDTRRYRLHDLTPQELREVVASGCERLYRLSGNRPIAYRAGGWCAQPFTEIADALFDHGVFVDSTVYQGGYSANPGRGFDYRTAPSDSFWRFDRDPTVIDPAGRFLEVPITPVRVGPSFYWRKLVSRIFSTPGDQAYGDGRALGGSGGYYWEKLTRAEHTVASVDGSRAGLLDRALAETQARGGTVLNVMGHPKALTPNSVRTYASFLARHGHELTSCTIRQLVAETELSEGADATDTAFSS